MCVRCSRYASLTRQPSSYARSSASISTRLKVVVIAALLVFHLVVIRPRHRLTFRCARRTSLRRQAQTQSQVGHALRRGNEDGEPGGRLVVDDSALLGELAGGL